MPSKAKLLIDSSKGSKVIVPVDGLAIIDFSINHVFSPYGLRINSDKQSRPIDLRSVVEGSGSFLMIKSDNYHSCIGFSAYCEGIGLIAHMNPSQYVVKGRDSMIRGIVKPGNEGSLIETVHGAIKAFKHHDFNDNFIKGYLKIMKKSGFCPEATSIVVCGGNQALHNSLTLFNSLSELLEDRGYSFNCSKHCFSSSGQNLTLTSNGVVVVETIAYFGNSRVKEYFYHNY